MRLNIHCWQLQWSFLQILIWLEVFRSILKIKRIPALLTADQKKIKERYSLRLRVGWLSWQLKVMVASPFRLRKSLHVVTVKRSQIWPKLEAKKSKISSSVRQVCKEVVSRQKSTPRAEMLEFFFLTTRMLLIKA